MSFMGDSNSGAYQVIDQSTRMGQTHLHQEETLLSQGDATHHSLDFTKQEDEEEEDVCSSDSSEIDFERDRANLKEHLPERHFTDEDLLFIRQLRKKEMYKYKFGSTYINPIYYQDNDYKP